MFLSLAMTTTYPNISSLDLSELNRGCPRSIHICHADTIQVAYDVAASFSIKDRAPPATRQLDRAHASTAGTCAAQHLQYQLAIIPMLGAIPSELHRHPPKIV